MVLEAGTETQVPLVVDSDFNGPSIDDRASDPRTGAILARLSLKNGRMDLACDLPMTGCQPWDQRPVL